jgi:formate dehydrogenase gamma subunit
MQNLGSPGWRLALLLVVLAAGGHAAEFFKDNECLECHNDKTLVKTNATGRAVSLFVDEAVLRASVHKTNSCHACHNDLTRQHPDDNVAAKPVDCARCHQRQSESYGASVHGLALKAGDASAPTCKDCHDTHGLKPGTDPASPLYFANLAKTCGTCHPQAAADVTASVHGKGVAEGRREPATCIACHSEHRIEQLKTGSSLKISADVCSNCHASERINTKFNLPKDRVQTFFASYHGLASQYGSALAANCASCHGYHLVLPSADPRSTIYRTNLLATCGKCHPGATENFAAGKIHLPQQETPAQASDFGGKVNAWVRRIYIFLIVATISVMLLHNGLLFLRKWLRLHRSERRTIVRMDRHQRWQHGLLLVSFIVLAATGFALKFPDSWIAHLLGAHEDFRRWSHRVAGVIMLGLGGYHVAYLLLAAKGRKLLRDFLPEKKDVQDVLTNVHYLSGASPEKAKLKRFGYPEKMEYWAVVWGTIIMGVTGLAIWFKIEVTQFLPRWAIDVATTIHYYEAILACLAILVWHFYHVMFDPEIYPVNLACWDGKVSEHWQEDEHPLEQPAPQAVVGAPAPTTEPKVAPALQLDRGAGI